MKKINHNKMIIKKLKETREWLLEGGDDIGIWLCSVALALAEKKSDENVWEIISSLD